MLIYRPGPLWYRVFLYFYGLCVTIGLISIPVILAYAIWKMDSGLLTIGLTALGIAAFPANTSVAKTFKQFECVGSRDESSLVKVDY